MPGYSVTDDPAQRVSTVVDALCLAELASTRADARRTILGGGFYLNDVRVTDPARELSTDDLLNGRHIALRKGKRTYAFLTLTR